MPAPTSGWGGFAQGLRDATAINSNIQSMAIQGQEEERKQAIFPVQKEAAEIGLRKAQYEERESKVKEEKDNQVLSANDFLKSQNLSEESQKLLLDKVNALGYGIQLPTGEIGIKRRNVNDVLSTLMQDKELHQVLNSNELNATIKRIGSIEEQMKNPKAKPEELQALKAQLDKEMIKKQTGLNAVYYGNEKLMQEKLKSEYSLIHEDRRDARFLAGQEGMAYRQDKSLASIADRFAQGQQQKMDTRKFEEWVSPDGKTVTPIRTGDVPPEGYTKKNPGDFSSPDSFPNWTPEQKDTAFKDTILTGKSPKFNYRDKASATAYAKEYNQYLLDNGMTPADVQAKRKSLDGLGASLKKQETNRGMMGSFVKNMNAQISRLDEIYKDIEDRTGLKLANIPIRKLKMDVIGSANESIVSGYLTEIENEINKLSQGSQASIAELSVESQEKWDKIHDKNLPIPEIQKILKETIHMGQIRMKSVNDEIMETRKNISDLLEKQSSASTGSPSKSEWISRARTANPGASSKELSDYYDQKYGGQ